MTKNHVPLGEDRPPVKTIVVVEDDRDIGEFFVEALKQEMPYQVVLATDGFQALKMPSSRNWAWMRGLP